MTNVSRRQALGCAAAVGVGVPLLAACGGGAGASGPPPKGTVLIKTSQVPVGGGVIVGDHQVIVTQPTAGEFRAFTTVCTHAGCPITSVHDQSMVCSCHHSQFSIIDGKNLVGPNGAPAGSTPDLPAVTIKVAGDDILTA